MLGVSDEGQERVLAAPMCGPSSWVGSAAGPSQLRVNQHLPHWGAKAHGDHVAVASVHDSLNMSSVLLNSVNGRNRSNSKIITQPPLLSTYTHHIVVQCFLFLTGFCFCCYSEKKLFTSLGKPLRVGADGGRVHSSGLRWEV